MEEKGPQAFIWDHFMEEKGPCAFVWDHFMEEKDPVHLFGITSWKKRTPLKVKLL